MGVYAPGIFPEQNFQLLIQKEREIMRAFLFFLLLAGVLHAQDFTVDSPYTAKKRRIKFSPHNHTQLNKKDTHSNRPPAQRLTELREL